MIGIFLLDMIDKMRVQLPIHHQNVIAFILRSLDVSILFLYVGSVQINDMIVLIRLVNFHQIFILFQGKILSSTIGLARSANFSSVSMPY